MLPAIEDMKYFLRTAFGDSSSFVGSAICLKFKGCVKELELPLLVGLWYPSQSSGRIKRKVLEQSFPFQLHSTSSTYPLSCLWTTQTFSTSTYRRRSLHVKRMQAIQAGVGNWDRLLMATGGGFSPKKRFYYNISFKRTKAGCWRYKDHTQTREFSPSVPVAGGGQVPIENISIDTAKTTLGAWMCPSGKAGPSLDALKKRTQAWVDMALSAKLPSHDIWFRLERQMWPGAGYGVANNLASWKQLKTCLERQ